MGPQVGSPAGTHLCCRICCMENRLAGSYSSIPAGETSGGCRGQHGQRALPCLGEVGTPVGARTGEGVE